MTGTQTPVISGAKLTAKNKRLRTDLEHRLNRWFQETSNHIGEALKGKYKLKKARKADSDDDLQTELLVGGKKIPKIQSDLIRALALLGWGAIKWPELVSIMQPYLEDAGVEGVDVGVGQVQMTGAGKKRDAAEQDAAEYAEDRSAELAGMKRDDDGNLVEDPEAHWPMTDVIKRDLEANITLAVIEGWTAEELAYKLEEAYAFSAERSAIIADTEISNAQSGGTYSLWRRSQTTTLVHWRVSGRHDVDDECDDYEAQGVVPLGHEFAPGLRHPRAHPFCECELEVVDPNDVFDSLPTGQ